MTEDQYISLKQITFGFINADKSLGKEIKFENIEEYIKRTLSMFPIECQQESKDRLFVDIEYQFKITHVKGHAIFDKYDEKRDWYSNSNIENPYFWNRYKSHLHNNTSINIRSINLMDEETLPNIMNCIGNPNDQFEGLRLRRGLIIGDVQSGKTATYSGLICKAADAGFKVVILLAGITESLRQQTQERIDEGIIGITSRKNGKIIINSRIGVGTDNKELKATSFTSCANDFVGNCDKIAMSLNSHKSLVLFVIKKNVSVLEKLYKWLYEQNIDPVKGCIDVPMLLIDDEADNASVNTKKDETDPTRTNKLIRQICNLFKNSSYVGFTATPFANVFIDPESVNGMKHADLFPEHFIYALEAPSNYVGASKIFYKEGLFYSNLRYINDIEEPDYTSEEYHDTMENDIESLNSGGFYYRHKKEWDGKLPDSLRDAVLCFFLANVIRDLRGQKASPRSMLINMSRFIKVQRVIHEHIENIYDDVFDEIRYNFSDDENQNDKLPLYQTFKRLWNLHFLHVQDISFKRVIEKQAIIEAIEKIKIMVVNGSKQSSNIDYRSNKSLRVIAVGGLALSRGLTLEGLLISYFYRNTATFDVLMQMGRWFGYRAGYEDVFQIWTSQISAEWYAEIARSSQELKDDIKNMYEQHLTPKDFGIKVRDNCDELQITASNKMRSATNINMLYSFYGNIYDTPYISYKIEHNRKNLEQIRHLSAILFSNDYKFRFANIETSNDANIYSEDIGFSRFFENVPKNIVLDFLRNIKCSMANMNFNVENILTFMNDPDNEGLDVWNVVFEGGDSNANYDIDGLRAIKCTYRSITHSHRNVVQISTRRRVLGMREGKFALKPTEIAEAEDTCRKAWIEAGENIKDRTIPLKAYFQYLPKRKPLLIIMLIQPTEASTDPNKQDHESIKKFREELGSDSMVAFAIGFPGVKEPEKATKYKINKVQQKLNNEDIEQDKIDDDE